MEMRARNMTRVSAGQGHSLPPRLRPTADHRGWRSSSARNQQGSCREGKQRTCFGRCRLFSVSPLCYHSRPKSADHANEPPNNGGFLSVATSSPLRAPPRPHLCRAIWNLSKRVQRDVPHRPSPDHGAGITAGAEVRRRPRVAATPWVCGAAPSFLWERR
jgi:hypothetical protein